MTLDHAGHAHGNELANTLSRYYSQLPTIPALTLQLYASYHEGYLEGLGMVNTLANSPEKAILCSMFFAMRLSIVTMLVVLIEAF